MERVNTITIHCTGTSVPQDAREINDIHKKRYYIKCVDAGNNNLKKEIHTWNGIGYHIYINSEGYKYTIEYGGTNTDHNIKFPKFNNGKCDIGSHVANYNRANLGICLSGDGRFDPVILFQLLYTLQKILPNNKIYPSSSNLMYHRNFNNDKTCPNFKSGIIYNKYIVEDSTNIIYNKTEDIYHISKLYSTEEYAFENSNKVPYNAIRWVEKVSGVDLTTYIKYDVYVSKDIYYPQWKKVSVGGSAGGQSIMYD